MRRPAGAMPRPSQIGRVAEPRLAPRTTEAPAAAGSAPTETSVTTRRIAATEECIRKVIAAPTMKAVTKSRAR